ncbi:hypothetical protein [Paenibacillus crassostreae]|uniref:hypothetical protein n=1 Tax=Paenibacillus crassostreae TaxID=1763538 RepID=UPI0012FE3C9A|nr:hypothetical protein [Paenibacillus crassostreae]
MGALSGVALVFLLELINVDSLKLIKVMPLISWASALAFALNGLRARKRGWIKLMRLNYWLGSSLVIIGYGWMLI